MQKETRSFQTEVKQLLHLMIHSLYSNRNTDSKIALAFIALWVLKRLHAQLVTGITGI